MTDFATPDQPDAQTPTPASRSVERVSSVLLAIEAAPMVGFRMAAAAVHDAAGCHGVVALRLAGLSFTLTPDEARMTARCIGFEDERRATGLLVSLFQSAAADAEAMAARAARAARGSAAAILAVSAAPLPEDAA